VTLAGHTDAVTAGAWSPDGSRILTASEDRTARLWDAATGNELLVLSGHSDGLRSVAWSPDGVHSVTASSDRSARIWLTWQTTADLIAYANACCRVRDLTMSERAQFNLEQ